jgi:hypothetical protein
MFIREADVVEGCIQFVGRILGIEASTAELQDSLPLQYGQGSVPMLQPVMRPNSS